MPQYMPQFSGLFLSRLFVGHLLGPTRTGHQLHKGEEEIAPEYVFKDFQKPFNFQPYYFWEKHPGLPMGWAPALQKKIACIDYLPTDTAFLATPKSSTTLGPATVIVADSV